MTDLRQDRGTEPAVDETAAADGTLSALASTDAGRGRHPRLPAQLRAARARRRHGFAARRRRPDRAGRASSSVAAARHSARLYNFATCSPRAAATIFIAMGLVFVLLLGEIDLAAGYTAGVCASVMARLMDGYGWDWYVTIPAALITGLFIGFLIGVLRRQGAHPVLRRHPVVLPGLPGRHADTSSTTAPASTARSAQRQGRQRVRQLADADLDGLAAAGRSWSSATPRRRRWPRRSPAPPGSGRRAGLASWQQDRSSLAVIVRWSWSTCSTRTAPEPASRSARCRTSTAQPKYVLVEPPKLRGRALRGAGAARAVRRADVRADPHPLRPPRLRGRRQRGGRPPRWYPRRPHPDLGVRASALHARGRRRHHDQLERPSTRQQLRRQHPAAGGRCRCHRRNEPVRRTRPASSTRSSAAPSSRSSTTASANLFNGNNNSAIQLIAVGLALACWPPLSTRCPAARRRVRSG